GIAPDCRILPVKISNGGTTAVGHIIEGCYLGFELGAEIVNLSWGSYGGVVPPEAAMVNYIWNNGGIFISAAGNDNTTDTHYPCAYQNSISVGWTHEGTNDARADFGSFGGSNYGTYVELAAPGDG